MSKLMTKEEKNNFIREKIAPLFDGMNANDILEITNDNMILREIVLSEFTVSSEKKSR
jgi:hypothetical protein